MFWDECVVKAQRLFKLAILPELVGNWMEHQPVVASLSPQKDILNKKRALSVSPTKQNVSATVIESDTDSGRESGDEADRL